MAIVPIVDERIAASEPLPDAAPASVAENIDRILRVEKDALERRSRAEAAVDAIGGFVGTVPFVVLQSLACAAWVALNSGKFPGLVAFDRFPFPLLSSITSFEAVVIAAFVLMKQNRISVIVGRRDHLDLQVNLRTERQATQIIQMLDRLSTHVGFEHDHDASGRELGLPVAIEHLVDELHRRLPDAPGG
jgi:uncharacterized membrane protein